MKEKLKVKVFPLDDNMYEYEYSTSICAKCLSEKCECSGRVELLTIAKQIIAEQIIAENKDFVKLMSAFDYFGIKREKTSEYEYSCLIQWIGCILQETRFLTAFDDFTVHIRTMSRKLMFAKERYFKANNISSKDFKFTITKSKSKKEVDWRELEQFCNTQSSCKKCSRLNKDCCGLEEKKK